ncbi:maleylacetoacetate isomerase [Acinetobacter wanghuae]|uniref:Maleylacetoacetate isomerase n=1 Tax=Acinetobacter wanghuae TaxID=2662362 RepID=A0A5Q0P3A4_9GAMM|nr:maleylacetoacetate isomerase [Acinetobacter wanghuae]MQW92256.1 maleylacetoacetate isomerase [Acinetobacter wanghuae]QGA10501.1 maleylacetoacetate isomerase [Acinetobacter wanghuae]
MQLYTYFRSSAAYRVRIALNLKGLNTELIPVHLVNNGGEQHSEAYKAMNPSELVPTFVEDDFNLSQSLSILEYLDEQYPEVALLPQGAQQRALVRAFSLAIACDIHPLNNLRVLQYLTGTLNVTDEQKTEWYKHWVETGFKTLEALLAESNGKFCFGDQATIADCCLIPQVYNALRFNIDLSAYPKITSIYQHCNTLAAFQNAAPEAQQEAK